MELESVIVKQRVSLIFSDTNSSNFIICKFKNCKQLFSLQNSKTTYYQPFQPISTVFHLLIKLVRLARVVHTKYSEI